MSANEDNKEKFSLSEGSLLEKEKVLGSNPAPSTSFVGNQILKPSLLCRGNCEGQGRNERRQSERTQNITEALNYLD